MNWMIYGANGYTGKLISEEAKKRGLHPILAGRREEAVRPLAEGLGLQWRAFDLDRPQLEGVDVVLHCAGPFSSTSQPMLNALLPGGKHYLDITGEISVFESLFRRGEEVKKAGSVVIPGVGFDVVPTDCLAANLKAKLPDATHLEMGMSGMANISPGTLKSMIEGFEKGGWIRENGKLKSVPTPYAEKEIDFGSRKQWCSAIPWGDVSTAFYSTGIPNITFYAAVPSWTKHLSRLMPFAQKVMGVSAIQTGLKALVDQFVKGPSEEHRNSAKMSIWGCVRNPKGEKVVGRLQVIEGYQFTVLSSLAAVERVLKGSIPAGVYTPSMAFGKEFLNQFSEISFDV